jgi:N-acetyl sugar amidotransferase
MKKCSRCVMPETQESILFDEEGICNVCRQIERKNEEIDWTKKKKELLELVNLYKGKGNYDCIVPISGGKDSTFQLYYIVKELGLKPLAVSFDHGFYRPKVLKLREKVLKQLGVDFLVFKPNWTLVKKLMKESLERKGDFCWHCHVGVTAYPIQIALKHKIPLIIYGEGSAEYTSYYEYANEEDIGERKINRIGGNLGITAEDMAGMIKVNIREMSPFLFPTTKEIKEKKIRAITLGSYIKWDTKKQSELIREKLGWDGDEVEGVPPQYFYEKVECKLQGCRDYIKYIKRGFARTTHLTSIDIRHEKMTREKALELVKEYDGKRPASLDYFLKIMDMTEEEFMNIALKHIISPNKFNKKDITPGKRLHDQELWYE